MSIHLKYFFGVALLLPSLAFAALGGAPAPVAPTASSGTGAKGMQMPVEVASFTVNEIQAPTGTIIKEYVSLQNVVFAVSWQGPIMPDLQQLLGDYFPSFQRAAVDSRSTGRRGPLVVDQADLVVQSGGHMRDYRGRAYVPGLVPADVTIDKIQ